MIARFVSVVVLATICLAFAADAKADWLCDFCKHVVRETKRRQCWPKPFIYPDRCAVRAPFVLMVSNGWRRQNMLADHHFVEGKSELTQSGRLKIRWILTEAPRYHRTIYVHTADSAETTAARIQSVRQLAASLVPQGELPDVRRTSISAEGWPASQVDLIGRKFESSTPDPRLPEPVSVGESLE